MDLAPIYERVTEAKAAIRQAVKFEHGYALEGDIGDANDHLDDALKALDRGDLAYAKGAIVQAHELLMSDESKVIAEDHDALESAIHKLDELV